MSDHELSLSESSCKAILSLSSFSLHQTFVSSANILISLLIQNGNSFTNIKKSSGPNTLPCGTPLSTSCINENVPLIPTLLCGPLRFFADPCCPQRSFVVFVMVRCGPVRFFVVLRGSLQTLAVPSGPLCCLLWSVVVLCGSLWSFAVLCRPLLSPAVLCGVCYGPLWSFAVLCGI